MSKTSSESSQASDANNHCIWMDAGTVAYKLCDLEFKCEICPLDELMRKKSAAEDEPPLSSLYASPIPSKGVPEESPDQRFQRQLDEFFKPLLAVQLPSDRLYHPCHMWVKDVSESSSTIGIDHIGAYFLQPVVSVVLPQTPSKLEQKSPCTWLVLREGTIALRSAVQGTAVQSNSILLDHPYLLLDDPYDSGWILKIQKPAEKKGDSQLYTADEFEPVYREEVVSLQEKFSASFRRSQSGAGTTLYDGGEPVSSVQGILGRKKYFELISRIFTK